MSTLELGRSEAGWPGWPEELEDEELLEEDEELEDELLDDDDELLEDEDDGCPGEPGEPGEPG